MVANPSEVFRFVAVRPVQLATGRETKVAVIRDPRVGTRDGLKRLAVFAQTISSPERARRRWAQVDLVPFAALATARRLLLDDYTGFDIEAAAPPGAPFVVSAGLEEVDPADDGLWDGLRDTASLFRLALDPLGEYEHARIRSGGHDLTPAEQDSMDAGEVPALLEPGVAAVQGLGMSQR